MTDDELDQRLRDAILAEEVDTSRVEHALHEQINGPRHVPGWAAAAAAVIAMIGAGALSYRTFVIEKATPQVCVAAAQDHHREVVNGDPRKWLTDLPSIDSLAEKQGVPASAIAAIATTGYRLERGRLCFLQKQIYLHLVYSKNAQVFSVYLRPTSQDPTFSDSVRDAKLGSEDLGYFQTRTLTAVFVSRTTGADAADFARASAIALRS
jgi:hypothetical protein